MPPAISDDENSNAEAHVTRDKKPVKYTEVEEDDLKEDDDMDDVDGKGAANGTAGDEDEGEEEDEDLEEDEYVVEKILSHFIDDDGNARYEVKWEGFEKKSDRTWEPEENLVGSASAILEEYFESIGGRDKLYDETSKALKTKKRGRPAASTPSGTSAKKARKNGDHPADSDPPAALTKKQWKPPAGSWENDVQTVDMYRDENGSLMIYLTWKNGEKTQHAAKQAYQRCPQKILLFYESKINFKTE